MEGRRRVTIDEQMSASDNSRARELAGLTLDDVLGKQKRLSSTPQPQPRKTRTLLEIIKEDESNKKDRRSWKAFKDKLRLKRAGSAWTSTVHTPTSDVPIPNPNSRTFTPFGRRNSVRYPTQTQPQSHTHSDSEMSAHYDARQVEDLDPAADDNSDSPVTASPAVRPQFGRRSSTRFTGDASPDNSAGSLRPQLSRRNSTNIPSEPPYRRGRVVTFRDSFDDEEDGEDGEKPGEGRALSAREAVAAQEKAEAEAQEAEEAEAGEHAPVTMSLMDLLTETDREMGLEGSRYILSDDEDFDEDDDEENDDGDDEDEDEGGRGSLEYTCCICMVRHKASAFIPCGHTFCRMCSRELMVSRGNCPLCNNFILEILDIF